MKHSDGSYHYAGLGGDVRWTGFRRGGVWVDMDLPGRNLLQQQEPRVAAWTARCRMALAGRWQVFLKPDHIHFERDPGT